MSLDSTSPGTGSAEPAPNDLLQNELLVEYRDDGVAVVCMNRPKATNALSLNLIVLKNTHLLKRITKKPPILFVTKVREFIAYF